MAIGTALDVGRPRIPASTGEVINVSTGAEVQEALEDCDYGSIIDGGGDPIDLSGMPADIVYWPSARTGGDPENVTTMRNCEFENGYPVILGDWFRFEDSIVRDSPIWGVKIEGARYVECVRVQTHDSVRSGFMVVLGSLDWQVWDSQVWNAGQIPDTDSFGAYGIYAEGFNNKCVVANFLVVNPERWAVHAYTSRTEYQTDGLVCAGVTTIHFPGNDRGGVIIQRDGGTMTNVKCVGFIVVGSDTGVAQCNEALSAGNRMAGVVEWDSTGAGTGLANLGGPIAHVVADPILDGEYRPSIGSPAEALVPAEWEQYLPATDMDGAPRLSADAGAYRISITEPPPDPGGGAETVTWEYDGAMEIVATIEDAEPGIGYTMFGYTDSGSGTGDTAVGSTLVLTVTDWLPVDGVQSGEMIVQRDDTGDRVGTNVFEIGNGSLTTPDVTWEYESDDTVRATFTTVLDQEYRLGVSTPALGLSLDSFTGAGGEETFEYVEGGALDGVGFVGILQEFDAGVQTTIGTRLFYFEEEGEGHPGNVGGGEDPGGGGEEPASPVGGCGGGHAWDTAAGRFMESPLTRVVVFDRDLEVVTFLDNRSYDKSMLHKLNAPCEAQCRVTSDDPEVNILYDPDDLPFVEEGVRFLGVFDEDDIIDTSTPYAWVARHMGILQMTEDSARQGQPYTALTSYDPWKLLYKRPCRVFSDPERHIPRQGKKYKGVPGSQIALELLYATIFYDGDVYIDAGDGSRIGEGPQYADWLGSPEFAGTIEETDEIDFEIQQGKMVGEVWSELCATGTMDIMLMPNYDPDRIGSGGQSCYISELNIFQRAGVQQNDAIFGWDRGGNTLDDITRMQDGTLRANSVRLFNGQGGPAVDIAEDAPSQSLYGNYWRQQHFPGQTLPVAVESMAEFQLSLLKTGRQTVTISPTPERMPLLYREFYLGDTVPVYASNRLRKWIGGDTALSEPIQYVRVYAIPVVIGDNSLQRVDRLLVSPQDAG